MPKKAKELTDLTNGQNSSEYPTEWHTVNDLLNVDCRQLTDDTFELRSPSHTIIVDSEGFNLYRTNIDVFEKWVEDKGITASVREITRD